MKMVKSLLLLGSAAGLVEVTAGQAADLPVKAKPVEYGATRPRRTIRLRIEKAFGDAGVEFKKLQIGGFARNELPIKFRSLPAEAGIW